MRPEEGAERVLDALAEPALLVGADGTVAFANRPALARFGAEVAPGGSLPALCPDAAGAEALRGYLRRCSGSRSPMPGVVELRDAAGATARFRCHAGLTTPGRDGMPARILLRLSGGDERFAALARKVRDLNDEIAKRRSVQARLEDALRERELLMRELHHRVRNNIHMLVGMLGAARREAPPEAAAALGDASRRLAAVGIVHQMLYRGERLDGVRADEFVARVASGIMEGAGALDRLLVEADPVEVPNDMAVPLALIINELLANALKHGLVPGAEPGPVRVRLAAMSPAAAELSVEDEGPGFDPEVARSRRASGLGLVRGLTRQLGGALSIGRGERGGAQCAVRFQVGQRARAAEEVGT